MGGTDAFFCDLIARRSGFYCPEDLKSILRLIEVQTADTEGECGFCPIRVDLDFRLEEIGTFLPALEALHTGDGLDQEIGPGRNELE